jgi:RNA polymerase sigma factor (sigma-70 family)
MAGASDLLERAGEGDDSAWDALVDHYGRVIWSVTRTHRLDEHDANDVFQTTWLRLLEHLGGIQNPEALSGWLSTTARREALRVLSRRGRIVLTDDCSELEPSDAETTAQPETGILLEELRAEVRVALAQLPPRYQQLLQLLMVDPPLHYSEIAEALDIPVGSIGPSRARGLQMLRATSELRVLVGADG